MPGGILPCVLCQVSIVDHDIHRVKVEQVSTPQYVFEDGLPVRVSNLSCSVILQRSSRTEFGPRVPCNKPGTCIKATPAIPTDSFPLQLAVLTGDDIQRHLPETLHVEATGLGGRDLSYPIPWDISIRTDKEGQAVYGPSLAPLEETVVVPGLLGGTQTLQVSALGRSKAAHEFLVLHYFALDSAKHWEALVSNLLPAVRLPATALEMFRATHIQPSHRRMPHVLWTDSMTLIWNLLMVFFFGGAVRARSSDGHQYILFWLAIPP